MESKVLLTQPQIEFIREQCKNSFKFFCTSLIPPEWFDLKFHGTLCEHLESKSKDRMVIMPRTHLKTTIAATFFPLWKAVNNPNIRILIVSNTSPNAEKTVHSIRAVVEKNKLFQALFPEVIPDFGKTRWSDRCACLERSEEYPEGTFEAVGVGANVIRRHFNLIIEDDTVAPKKDELSGEELMPSKEDIEKAIGFHKLTIPLLITFEQDERIVIGTRWAEYDLLKHIMENECNKEQTRRFSVLDIPAFTGEGDEEKAAYKRFSMEALDAIKAGLGTYMFSALYLNKPLAEEYMKFRPAWVKYYSEDEVPEDGVCVVTIDPADPPTGKKTQAYSVALSAVNSKKGLFVRRYRRGRFTDKEIISHAFDIAEEDGAIKIRIEADRYPHLKAAFKIEMAKREVHYIIEEVKSRGRQKEARIMRIAPIAENGLLFIKRGMNELENEMFHFPRGRTVDILDALAWQILDNFQIPDYTKPKPEKKAHRYNTFTFDEIIKSTQKGSMRYPFQRQFGRVGAERWS